MTSTDMRTLGTIIAAVVIAAAATPAAAQSDFCLPLQMELARLNEGQADGARNDRAARQELARLRDQARRSGCLGGLFSKKKSGGACRSIVGRMNQLERQIAGSRPRGFFFGRSYEDRERDRIRRALARAGCAWGGDGFAYGGYRTICVRLCDGYYFPINFSTSRQRFAADATKCINQYALGDAELYYYPTGGDPAQAVSLSGQRYFQQPNAFAFRQAFHPQCAIRLHEGLAALGARVTANLPPAPPQSMFEQAAAKRMATDKVPIPIPRQDWSDDPETTANRAGGLVPGPVKPEPTMVAADGSIVRTIGDPYLFAEANPGPPATIPGYKPPELKDFRLALKASMVPGTR
jgi:hypothetical protein